uniref:Uncharacterized protein MANES_12G117000 n=1 Tax=Rhizophora mucronata TaxID=61149 RepID=A0A2P2N352_RHIMU
MAMPLDFCQQYAVGSGKVLVFCVLFSCCRLWKRLLLMPDNPLFVRKTVYNIFCFKY